MPGLNPFDDYPFHQTAAPIDVPATSDTHFNDGYYFAFYRPGVHVFCGLRLHPNSNVMDGYAGVVWEGEQRDVRFSRALRPRANDLAVGPFRLDIVEPMSGQRIRLDDPELGLAFDVSVPRERARLLRDPAPAGPPRAAPERRASLHAGRAGRRRAHGGRRVARRSTSWYACRDHSWGIRSTMGPYAPLGGPEEESPDPRALRLWVPFECGDVAGFFHCHEAHDGSVLDCEGLLHRGDEPPLRIDAVGHELRYEDGTRRLAGGRLTLHDETGAEHEYRLEVACPPAHPQGYGYTRGWSDGGQPGVYRGLDVIERDRFDVSDPAVAAGAPHLAPERRLGGTEFVSTIAGPGGAEGMAHVEHMLYPRRGAGAARRRRMSGFVQRHGLLQGQGLDLGPYTLRYAPGERTMVRVLADRAADRPEKDWIVFDGVDRLTFGGAWEQACRIGHAFDRDLPAGAHVGLFMRNQPEFLVSFYGALVRGGLAVPLNAESRGPLLHAVIEHSDIEAIVVRDELVERLDDPARPRARASRGRRRRRAGAGRDPRRPRRRASPTGSTGRRPTTRGRSRPTTGTRRSCTRPARRPGPKGAVYTHQYLYLYASLGCDSQERTEDDVLTAPLPLFHAAALHVISNACAARRVHRASEVAASPPRSTGSSAPTTAPRGASCSDRCRR